MSSVIKGKKVNYLQYSALIEDSDTQIPSVRPEEEHRQQSLHIPQNQFYSVKNLLKITNK